MGSSVLACATQITQLKSTRPSPSTGWRWEKSDLATPSIEQSKGHPDHCPTEIPPGSPRQTRPSAVRFRAAEPPFINSPRSRDRTSHEQMDPMPPAHPPL